MGTHMVGVNKAQRYVSNELSHFVGKDLPAADDQYKLLVSILNSGWLTHPPHDPSISGNLSGDLSAKISTNEMYNPQVVCFCDIPVQDIHLHASKYSPCGLAFSKTFVVGKGGAPVFYLPRGAPMRARKKLADEELMATLESGGSTDEDVSLGELFDRILPDLDDLMEKLRKYMKEARKPLAGTHPDRNRLFDLRQLLDFRVFSYVKFFDETLADDDPENFYMEREWRVVGNVQFAIGDVARVFIPRAYGERLSGDVPGFFGQVTFID
jgi:hypothetical protein